MASDKKERVGIIGVGRMGHSMLKHLVKHGYQVTACDVSAEALAKAREAGAKTADSPAALAKQCDFVILGVGYTPEVEAVVYGDGGLLANLAKGAIIAVSSTTSPYVVQEIEKAAKPKGIGVLDAPICRGRFAADEGTLLALVGGAPDVVERGRAVYGMLLLRLRASRRRRPRPGRQDHEQPAALDQRGRLDRGGTARGDPPASISSSCATR